jgi:hypothetical protein
LGAASVALAAAAEREATATANYVSSLERQKCGHRDGAGKSGPTAEAHRPRPGNPLRDQQTPEALSAYQKTEAEKWWPDHQGG